MALRQSLHFWRYYRRHAYAEALACLSPAAMNVNPLVPWALYRLGLYASVLRRPVRSLEWNGAVARTSAHAACGQLEAARITATQIRRPQQRLTLTVALAGWMPDLALAQIADLPRAPLALRAALLLRVGDVQGARTLLNTAFASGAADRDPQLHLLSNFTESSEPARQLASLNAFLAAADLTPVRLRDASKPPGANNLDATALRSAVDGPLVSVLMTTYRSVKRVSTAIASVLAQSYSNLELIVVDDASEDDTPEIVRDWCRRDNRVRLIILPSNVGPYLAKHVGLRQARGAFITCHDSDDWSHPLKIEQQVAPLLANPQRVATTSLWVRLHDDGRPALHRPYPLARLNPSSLLFRRQPVLEKTGAWDLVRTGADSEIIARLKLVFGRQAVQRLAIPLAIGGYHPDSLINAPATGHGETGISKIRLDYWEAWNAWHIEQLRTRRVPRLSTDAQFARPFAVPAALQLPAETINAALLSS